MSVTILCITYEVKKRASTNRGLSGCGQAPGSGFKFHYYI